MGRQRIQLRRDTASAWAASNPVLLAGEVGVETDTRRLKIGDGETSWADLGYTGGGAAFLGDLLDVTAANPVEGSVLTYDEATAKFVADSINTRLTLADGGNF
jgi:hypothetical protein